MHAVVVLVAVMTQVAAQTPPRDTPRTTAGTATVSGRVTDRESGQPLRRMTVRMSLRGDTSRTFDAMTSPEGRYELSGLTAGEYDATASIGEYRGGYLPTQPLPLTLKAGETRTDVHFAMSRAYAIEGHVVNEYGDPLVHIVVSVERIDRRDGSRSMTTDDRGHFRLHGLAPGVYRVCGSGDGQRWNPPASAEALSSRYARTCFPALANAPPLALTSADVTGVVIQMQRSRAYTLSGRVVSESTGPRERVSVNIGRVDPYSGGVRYGVVTLDFSPRQFVVRGLTPGDYVVRATVHDPPDASAVPTEGSGPREIGYLPVRIDAADVSAAVVTTTRGVDVAGRLLFDGERPPAAGQLSVAARRDEATVIYRDQPVPPARVKDDLTFELPRLHGPVILTVSGLPAGWTVKEIRYGNADIRDVPVEFTSGAAARAVQIVLTNPIDPERR